MSCSPSPTMATRPPLGRQEHRPPTATCTWQGHAFSILQCFHITAGLRPVHHKHHPPPHTMGYARQRRAPCLRSKFYKAMRPLLDHYDPRPLPIHTMGSAWQCCAMCTWAAACGRMYATRPPPVEPITAVNSEVRVGLHCADRPSTCFLFFCAASDMWT